MAASAPCGPEQQEKLAQAYAELHNEELSLVAEHGQRHYQAARQAAEAASVVAKLELSKLQAEILETKRKHANEIAETQLKLFEAERRWRLAVSQLADTYSRVPDQ